MEQVKPKQTPTIPTGRQLEAGTYIDIVSIEAPASASPGQQITVTVKVKNLYSAAIYIAVTGSYGTTVPFSPDYITAASGATVTFSASFLMPSTAIILYIWAWYWTGSDWFNDDTEKVSIALGIQYPAADIADFNVTVSGGISYPAADIADLTVTVSGGIQYPAADIAELVVTVSGGIQYPPADISDLVVAVGGGIQYPRADISELVISVSGGRPPEAELFANLAVTYKKVQGGVL